MCITFACSKVVSRSLRKYLRTSSGLSGSQVVAIASATLPPDNSASGRCYRFAGDCGTKGFEIFGVTSATEL